MTYRSLKNMIDALSTETSTTPVIQLTQSHAPGMGIYVDTKAQISFLLSQFYHYLYLFLLCRKGSKSNHATSTMGHPGCAASNSSMTPIPRVVAPLVSFRISHLMFGSYRPSLPPTLAPASVRNEGICFQAPVMNDCEYSHFDQDRLRCLNVFLRT